MRSAHALRTSRRPVEHANRKNRQVVPYATPAALSNGRGKLVCELLRAWACAFDQLHRTLSGELFSGPVANLG
jgi:hypothetical protein